MSTDTTPPRPLLPPALAAIAAYVLALAGAPLLVAALGFWIMGLPVFALYAGWLPYLVLAGPGFWLALRQYEPSILTFAGVGLALNILSPGVYAAYFYLQGTPFDRDLIEALWILGAIFSALWGGALPCSTGSLPRFSSSRHAGRPDAAKILSDAGQIA